MDSQIFKSCCHDFEQYPDNLPRSDVPPKKLDAYVRQLDEREDVLFSFPEEASLDFWDLHDGQREFTPVRATSLGDMRPLCCVGTSTDGQNAVKHPICRFLFLYSKNSRSRLYTTRDMLMLALSYHQVLPWFLEFLFPFGKQTEQHDFRFSSLRHKSYVDYEPTLAVKHLDRSGQDIHMCYNLKAVEPTSTNKLMPWSVRQTVIYHSFDTINGQSFWIVLKGNNSMSEDLRPETNRMRWQGDDVSKTRELSFTACLQTHLSVCGWACENWRPYINHLQIKMDQLTNQSIRTEVVAAPLPMPTLDTDDLFSTQPARRGTQILRRLTTWRGNTNKDTYDSQKTGMSTTLSDLDMLEKAPRVQATPIETVERAPYPEIKMSDLQKAQKIEEDTTDALFYLRSNVKIVKALRERYREFPSMTPPMKAAVSRFDSQLQDVIYELEMHESSLETLLKLFVERKNLVRTTKRIKIQLTNLAVWHTRVSEHAGE